MIANWSYKDEYEQDRTEILDIVDRVFSSGRLILGSSVASFEADFAAFCGTRYGIGVNSGTDALFLALKALAIGAGDEVITVANTAVPTVAAIRATGAMPVFVDVEEDTFLLDPEKLEKAVTRKTKCILPVHLFGQAADMDRILEVAVAKGISVVEDCAQAAGALYKGKRVGSMGDIGAFSFYPTKILGAFGDGGMAVTGREHLQTRLRRLRFYGMDKAYYSEEEGFNSRLDEVQAAILHFKLEKLEKSVQKRRAIAEQYAAGLAGVGDILLPAVKKGRTHQYYVYTIKTEKRDALREALQEQGIEARINYPVPVHLMQGYAHLGYKPGDLPVTEHLAGRILSLPMYPALSSEKTAQVVEAVRSFFRVR